LTKYLPSCPKAPIIKILLFKKKLHLNKRIKKCIILLNQD
jgi:hypothetical protein